MPTLENYTDAELDALLAETKPTAVPQISPEREAFDQTTLGKVYGGLQELGETGLAKGIERGSRRTGLGLLDVASDIAPEMTAGAFGVEPEQFQSTLEEQVGRARRESGEAPISENVAEILPELLMGGAARGLKGAMAIGGALGAKEATIGEESRLENIAKSVALAGVADKAIRGLGVGADKAAKYLGKSWRGTMGQYTKNADDYISGLAKRSNELYNKLDAMGVSVVPEKAKKVRKLIDKGISKRISGNLDDVIHPMTFRKISNLNKRIDEGKLSLTEFENVRKSLGKTARQTIDGKATEDAMAASVAIDSLDNAFDNLTEAAFTGRGKEAIQTVKDARKIYRNKLKYEKVNDLIQRADGDPNKLKSLFKAYTDKKKNLKGFSPQEKEVLVRVGKQGVGEGLLKSLGKFGFDIGSGASAGNTVIPTLLTGLGATGTPLALPAAALGTGARALRKAGVRGSAEDVLRTLQTGAVPQTRGALADIAETVPLPTGQLGAAGGLERGVTVEEAIPVAPSIQGLSDAELDALLGDQPITVPEQPVDTTLPEDLVRHEGLRFKSYPDTKGKVTVGYGFNMDNGIARKVWKQAGVGSDFDDVYKGEGEITPQEAERLGQAMMTSSVSDADALYPRLRSMPDSQQEALVELAYNMGRPSLSGMTTFNKAINKGDKVGAVQALLKSKWAKDVGKRRAKDLVTKIMQGGTS